MPRVCWLSAIGNDRRCPHILRWLSNIQKDEKFNAPPLVTGWGTDERQACLGAAYKVLQSVINPTTLKASKCRNGLPSELLVPARNNPSRAGHSVEGQMIGSM